MWQLGRDTSHVPAVLEYPRGGRLEMDRGPKGQSGVWHDHDATNSLPYCRYGGIVLLEENTVSNCPIHVDGQDTWVKALIHIALACKLARNYM